MGARVANEEPCIEHNWHLLVKTATCHMHGGSLLANVFKFEAVIIG